MDGASIYFIVLAVINGGWSRIRFWLPRILSLLLILSLGSLIAPPALTSSAQGPSIFAGYHGQVPLSELAAGEVGRGWIVLRQEGAETGGGLSIYINKSSLDSPAVAEVYEIDTFTPDLRQSINQATAPPTELKPSVRIEALSGRWVVDGGGIVADLNLQVFGPIEAMRGARIASGSNVGGWLSEVGSAEPTVMIRVRDDNGDGRPDWDLRQLLPEFPGRGYYRTNYSERKCPGAVEFIKGPIPEWPLITFQGRYEQKPGVFRPPIVVDPDTLRVTHVSEVVTARNQACSYTIYSINQLQFDGIALPNFGAPFASYDLTEEGQTLPNLILRAQLTRAGDRVTVFSEDGRRTLPAPRTMQSVRYSWRLAPGDRLWDYKIEVLGFHPYETFTPLANGRLIAQVPSYEEFPEWVKERDWPVATFISTEGNSYRSSEGIYEWSPTDLGVDYLNGWSRTVNSDAFTSLPAGFRGEYRFGAPLPAELYFSPVDRRLHLLGAQAGLWLLERNQPIIVKNLDSDDYLDVWIRSQEEAPDPKRQVSEHLGSYVELLMELDGYLLFANDQSISLLDADAEPSAFRLQPPSSHSGWLNYQDSLAGHGNEAAISNSLQEWFQGYDGPALELSSARIVAADYDDREREHRLYLDFRAPASITGDLALQLGNLEIPGPGHYVMNLGQEVSMQEADPVDLVPRDFRWVWNKEGPQAGNPGSLTMRVRNQGGWPAQGVSALLEGNLGESGWVELGSSNEFNLYPGGEAIVSIDWIPPQYGAWQMRARFESADQHPLYRMGTFGPDELEGVFVGEGEPLPVAISIWELPFHMVLLASLAIATAVLFTAMAFEELR